MPGDGSAVGTQLQGKNYLVYQGFESMDTQQARIGLQDNRLAWCENQQIIGPNDLFTVPGPAKTALLTIPNETITLSFYANYNNSDLLIAFCQSGAAYQVAVGSGTSVKFAAAGTFSANPDCTTWASQRILIADPTAGYCTWDGTAFVKSGGISPNVLVTAGGTLYNLGATVAFTGGSGSGAAGTVTVVGGIVTAITITNAGTGYKAADTITATISPAPGGTGSGATATAIPWPQFTLNPTTLAVYQGRVWLAGGRTMTWTGTSGYDDAKAANASGSTILSDADLVHSITALRGLNNFLYIFGDNSIKQIGTISVSGSATVFTIVTLSSDQGTTFPQTVLSYNRLILFANKVGVYAIFGASVEKISAQMDGIFQNIVFDQPLQAALNDINNIHCYMVLADYNDAVKNITRTIFMVFMNKKWFLVSQGNGINVCVTVPVAGLLRTYASSGNDITQILADPTVGVPIRIQTALSADKKPYIQKRALRYLATLTEQGSSPSQTIAITIDTENGSFEQDFSISLVTTWVNNAMVTVPWTNASGGVVTWAGVGNVIQREPAVGTGIYLGMTMTGTFVKLTVANLVLEYQDTTAMVSTTAV